jgi:leucine-rich repeat kinase 1
LREERRGLVEIGSNTIHHILLQLLSALEYFHQEGLNYHTLRSDNVLLWCMDPISIKLSDSGITHMSHGCELCSYIKAVPSKLKKTQTATRIDYMLLGLLIYEIATGIQPYEHVYDLGTVALALLHKKLKINVEAELNNNGNNKCRKTSQRAVSCHRMCMQSSMEECIVKERLAATLLKARLSLCGGNHEWSPMRLTLNPECVLCSGENDLIYWASGSRGLVMGTLDISTGSLNSNILQEAPRPESGLFAHRRGKPVPIAVGRATALTLVEETQQLWVGTENGSSGSVYVFKLPDMRRHHYIRLQDAVLSLVALNKISVRYGGDEMKYRVLVGLANGTIIQFIGVHKDKILENPLQGPRVVVHLVDHKPCIAMQLTAQGHLWCSSGNSVEVLDAVTLRGIRKLPLTLREEGKEHVLKKNDVITLMSINRYGVWTVGRRSPILRLWNQESGNFIASYDIHTVLTESGDDITAMAVQGGGVWLGTRNGFIFLLDAAAVLEKRGVAHLGLQHCGEGRVKNIVPLVAAREVLAKLEVFCSLEYPDEVSGAVMTWQFQCQQEWRPRPTGARRHSDPLPTPDDPPPPPLSSQPAST